MKRFNLTAAFLCLFLTAYTAPLAQADGYQGIRADKILTSTTASNGQPLHYLCAENPEVTALTVEIPPGGETGWHTHSVPVYAYMLGGRLTVEMEGGKSFEFKEGEVIFEVMDTPHNGRNLGDQPARLVVFYTGEVGRPNVTRVEATEGK